MKIYSSGLIGLDVKSRSNFKRNRKNRFRSGSSSWLFGAIIALVGVGIIVVIIR